MWIDDPLQLLTWNRFDLAAKVAYLRHRHQNTSIFKQIYKEHIRAFTRGSFTEHDNHQKSSIAKYLQHFHDIYASLDSAGFNSSTSVLPIADDGSILNGAHRTACAIVQNRPIAGIRLGLKAACYDWQYFAARGMAPQLLDVCAEEFVAHAPNTYVALMWPRSGGMHNAMFNLFENVVYRKQVQLTPNGMYALVLACYGREPWAGTRLTEYRGVIRYASQLYDDKYPLDVVAFTANDADTVTQLKDRLREVAGIGKLAVHITDAHTEARDLASLLFNNNGIHFINYGKPVYVDSIKTFKERLIAFTTENKLDLKDIVIDSGAVMELYGLRKSNDLDILIGSSTNNSVDLIKHPGISLHDSQVRFHHKEKDELIYNPLLNFTWDELKYVSLSGVFSFKRTRADLKDRRDIALMRGIITKRDLRTHFHNIHLKIYFRARRIRTILIQCARRYRFYWIARAWKRHVFNRD